MTTSTSPRRSNADLRILIPEGSSLSAREAIAALGPLGYALDVCDPNPLCVCRFSRFVRNFYRCPRMGQDPGAYYAFLLDLIQRNHYAVLLPIHENAMLFSRAAGRLSQLTGLAVAKFEAFERLQSKVAFTLLLDELDLPHPPTRFITSLETFETCREYPYYVKLAYGTAGFGTWRVANSTEQAGVIQSLQQHGFFEKGHPLLVQSVAPGILEVAQSVFDQGRLIAVHCYRQTAVGVGGSAAARVGIQRPQVLRHLEKIGAALHWHGSLMLDYIYDETSGQIAYIDPNPRLGETMNAAFSGVNLAQFVVRLSLGESIATFCEDREHLESHILITLLLGIALRTGKRLDLIKELLAALLKTGRYRNSREDFASLRRDFLSLIPLLQVAAALLVRPQNALHLASQAVDNYALTQAAIDQIRQMPQER